MHPRSGRPLEGGRARYWGRTQEVFDRVLLVLGAIALVALVPMLWIWLLYGSSLGARGVYAAATGLSLLSAGIGFAMIRILDGRR